MEGVDNHGRFYLFDRPSPQAVQNKLWMLLLSAEQSRDELRDQLKYKVETLARREEGLLEWQNTLGTREWKLESGEDSLCSMMRELRVKDMLLGDKDDEIRKIRREMEDSVRHAREDVCREVEVGCCVWCCFLLCLFRI